MVQRHENGAKTGFITHQAPRIHITPMWKLHPEVRISDGSTPQDEVVNPHDKAITLETLDCRPRSNVKLELHTLLLIHPSRL